MEKKRLTIAGVIEQRFPNYARLEKKRAVKKVSGNGTDGDRLCARPWRVPFAWGDVHRG